jgi:hypothetical protein
VEQVQTTIERGANTLMCFYREADNHGGTSVCLHRSRAQTLTPLHANQPGGFFPHGFRGLSLLKVFCPVVKLPSHSSCHAFLHMCTTHTYSSQKSLLLSSTTQESTFFNSNAPHIVLLAPNLGTPCLLFRWIFPPSSAFADSSTFIMNYSPLVRKDQ